MRVIEIPEGMSAFRVAMIKGCQVQDLAIAKGSSGNTKDMTFYEMFRELVNSAEQQGYTEICFNEINEEYHVVTDMYELIFRIFAFRPKTEPRKALKDIAWF